ncbi:MAG: DUF1579 family protein [Phycisphaerales bacterium]|nr:MAG: DUF1579 family protein [Phycisphaerales bacterium]
MVLRLWLGAAVLVGAFLLVTKDVVSQDRSGLGDERDPVAATQESGEDSEGLVDIWVRHAMPGEHHKLLGKLVGRWDMAVRYRMNAEAPVVESAGSCTRKWILGGRFVLEDFDGGNLGLPFQGLSIYGYDAFTGRYTCVWVDTTSTAVTRSLGTCRDDCALIAFTGQHGDPWSGQMRNSRGVTRLESKDRHVLELYEPDRDGTEFKVLEIIYTRAQQADEE